MKISKAFESTVEEVFQFDEEELTLHEARVRRGENLIPIAAWLNIFLTFFILIFYPAILCKREKEERDKQKKEMSARWRYMCR